MYKYKIILYWSTDDDAFIAEVPELPGCFADGTTQKEAIDNIETVITEWIETAMLMGRTVPEPQVMLKFA
jgi:predicted RNase H-like HicB family nuclease